MSKSIKKSKSKSSKSRNFVNIVWWLKHCSVWTSIGSEIFEKQLRLCLPICAQTRKYNNNVIGDSDWHQ